MGDLVADPAVVFGASPTFLVEPPRRVLLLGGGYLDFVARGVRAGLFALLAEDQLPVVCGERVYSGSFAVRKDELEDRPIASMEMQNAMLIPGAAPSVRFPYPPALGTLTLDPGTQIRIDKRDARAYVHTLAVDEAWVPWFALPPLVWHGRKVFPAYRAWLMGFGASPCVAQAVTDVATSRARLPDDRRVKMGSPAPSDLPFGAASWTMCGVCAMPVVTPWGLTGGWTP